MSDEAAVPGEEEPTVAPVPPPAARWQQTALGVLILLAGISIGAAGTVLIGKEVIRRRLEHPDRMSVGIARQMTRSLDLSPDQAKQVEAIVDQRMRTARGMRNDARRQVEQELSLMRDEVAEVLDKEQARRWRAQFERARRARPYPPVSPWPRPGPYYDGRGAPPGGPASRPRPQNQPPR
jgi:Spy/CpxP family protein refolding chaperone